MTWYKERTQQLRDFTRFGRALILSGDIDPQFPILRSLYKGLDLDQTHALWFSSVYLIYYHLGSACQAWESYPSPDVVQEADWRRDLPYFKQRRCFRGNDYARDQLNSLVEASDGDLSSWVIRLVGGGGEEGWTRLRSEISTLPYHGPWSSYKFCDMAKFVHHLPITAPDIGTKPGDTAGPIAGLTSLTGLSWKQCAEDIQLHRDLLSYLLDEGVPASGLDVLESILCDWQSLIRGRYYVGHDVDRDQEQLHLTNNDLSRFLWGARRSIFDPRLLGEVGGWYTVQRHLNGVYRSSLRPRRSPWPLEFACNMPGRLRSASVALHRRS